MLHWIRAIWQQFNQTLFAWMWAGLRETEREVQSPELEMGHGGAGGRGGAPFPPLSRPEEVREGGEREVPDHRATWRGSSGRACGASPSRYCPFLKAGASTWIPPSSLLLLLLCSPCWQSLLARALRSHVVNTFSNEPGSYSENRGFRHHGHHVLSWQLTPWPIS